MLVLSRSINQKIVIGQDITITVVDIRGDKVRLGIEAPSSVSIHREEVFEAIKREESRNTKKSVNITHSVPKGTVDMNGVYTSCCDILVGLLPLEHKLTEDSSYVTCKGIK